MRPLISTNNEAEMALDIDRLASVHGRRVFSAACRVLGDAELADVQHGSCLRLLERPTHNDVEHWAAYHRLKASAIATQAPHISDAAGI